MDSHLSSAPTDACWYTARPQSNAGPFTWSQLHDQAARGELSAGDLILAIDSTEWMSAGSVPGLFAATTLSGDAGSEARTLSAPDAPRTRLAGDLPPTVSHHLASSEPQLSWPTIPGYQILGILGRGGMGVVYKAKHVQLKRLVALKMVLSGAHADLEELSRFRKEAEAVARLQHPNIVQIYDVGDWRASERSPALPYFSLEFVDGGTLGQKLTGNPQVPTQAAQFVETVVRAVHAAHQRGIVHRDLKPGNILLASGGRQASGLGDFTPKITDFGLAKQLDVGGDQTRTGAILGTPSYMAPEQAAGRTKEIGPLTDVYALGVILYELLTGRAPFRGADPMDTLDQVRFQEPVPPRRLQPKVPRDLETICLKCLFKEPKARYASAEALAEDLASFGRGEPIRARPTGSWERATRWMRRNPAQALAYTLFVLLIVFGLGGGGVTALWQRAETSARQAQEARERIAGDKERLELVDYINRLQLVQREWQAGNVVKARTLLQGCPERPRHFEWHYLAQLTAPELLTTSIQVRDPMRAMLHPDGSAFVTVSGDDRNDETINLPAKPGIHVWDVHTGKLKDSYPGFGAAFSADGSRLATALNGDVQVWQWFPRALQLTIKTPSHFFIYTLSWSPDGALLATTGAPFDKEVHVWNATNGQAIATLQDDAPSHLAFSPDGRLLACESVSGVRVWDVKQQALLYAFQGMWHSSPTFSPDGGRLAVHDGRTVKICDSKTGKSVLTIDMGIGVPGFDPDDYFGLGGLPPPPRSLGTRFSRDDRSPAALESLEFSPDSTRLAGVVGRGITIWDVHTGKVLQRLHAADPIGEFTFFKDGWRLATFSGRDKGPLTLRVYDTLQTRTQVVPEHLTTIDAVAAGGKVLASWGNPYSPREIRIWNADDGRQLHRLPAVQKKHAPVLLPDQGRRLIKAEDKGAFSIWDTQSGARLADRVHEGGQDYLQFAVALGENRLATASGTSVAIWDLKTYERQVVLPTSGGTHRCFSADGTRLAITSGGKAAIWDVERGMRLLEVVSSRQSEAAATPDANRFSVSCFSPDGRLLLCGLADGEIKIHDAADGKTVGSLLGHTDAVTCAAYSPDGKRLFTAANDSTIKVWDPVEGKELLSLQLLEPRKGGTFSDRRFDSTLFGANKDGTLVYYTGGNVFYWDAKSDPARLETQRQLWHRAGGDPEFSFARPHRWFAASFHLSQLLARDPANPELYSRRGDTYARLKEWGKAVKDFQKVLDLARSTPPGPDALVKLALAHLGNNEVDKYRAIVRELLARVDGIGFERLGHCLLVPLEPREAERALAFTGKVLSRLGFHAEVHGASLLRAGKYQKAITELTSVGSLMDGDLYLALAKGYLNQMNEATTLLDAVDKEERKRRESPWHSSPWEYVLRRQVLRAEVDKLLIGGKRKE